MFNKEFIDKLLNDTSVRLSAIRESHLIFFAVYLRKYLQYPMALFQRKMIHLSETTENQTLVITSFRGSAKSTIFTLSYPIWAILGAPKKKFVLIVSKNMDQARLHLSNIRKELEDNTLLRNDLGPFKSVDEKWGMESLVIDNHGARISAVSIEQSIRGLRYLEHRPDLIIFDDIENLDSIKTKANRDAVDNWITGEIIAAGSIDTKTVFVGNKLHVDGMMMRLKGRIERKEMNGVYLEVPLVENGKITWPGKFPNDLAVEAERKRIGNDTSWQREYLLKIVDPDDQIIKQDMIRYFKEIPPRQRPFEYQNTYIGIDLASSLKSTADYTTMVVIDVFGYNPDLKIFVRPFSINKRLDFNATINEARHLADQLSASTGKKCKIFVENNGYQDVLAQELRRFGYDADGIHSSDSKDERLSSISHLIINGNVLFPETGTEDLINQMIYLGVEAHDDLVDAFTLVVREALKRAKKKVDIGMITGDLYHIGAEPYNNPNMTNNSRAEYYRKMKAIIDENDRRENEFSRTLMGV